MENQTEKESLWNVISDLKELKWLQSREGMYLFEILLQ